MKERNEYLDIAKKVLLRSDFDNRNRMENLVETYDLLFEILSVKSGSSVSSTSSSSSSSSSTPSLSPLESLNLCHHRFGRNTTKNRHVDVHKVLNLLHTEADLFRALRLTCLLLLSITDQNNHTRNKLQITTRQCEVLVRILIQNIRDVNGNENNYGDENEDINNIWDVRIRELTANDDDDKETENILLISKDQLEEEEQELLRMAVTPFPTTREETHQQFSQTLLLEGNLISIFPSSSSSAPLYIPVELDDRGILRTCNRNDNHWWALTPQSAVESNVNDNSSKMKITNIISSEETAADAHSTVTLDVGRDGIIWKEYIGKVKQYLVKVKEEQDEIKIIWSDEDVITAQTRAKNSINSQV